MSDASPKVIQPFPARHLLRNTNFCFFWIGSTISLFGGEFSFVALPWLVLQVTGSGVALGTILMVEAAPRAAFMLIGGAISDRFSSRRILLLTTIAHMIVVAWAAELVYFHAVRLWHLYLLAFAFGFADAFALPARQSLIPLLVSENQLPAANSLMSGSAQISSIAGPAPAGVVLRLWGIATAFLIDAGCFFFVILALLRLKDLPSKHPETHASGMWRSMIEGLSYVAKDPPLRSLMLLSAVLNLGVAGPLAIGLAFVADKRFSSATAFGTMLSFLAAGALIGSLLPAFTNNPRRRGLLMLIISGVLGCGMMAVGVLHHLIPIIVILTMLGLGSGLVGVQVQSWVQTRVERNVLGRVMSVFMFAALSLMPVSYALAGFLAQINLTILFMSAGSLVLVTTCIAAINQEVRHID
jgi:MFS family permease